MCIVITNNPVIEFYFMGITASCRNEEKDCVHKTQNGWTLLWTLYKRELHAPGYPFLIHDKN
jgi:hypothetical protein